MKKSNVKDCINQLFFVVTWMIIVDCIIYGFKLTFNKFNLYYLISLYIDLTLVRGKR